MSTKSEAQLALHLGGVVRRARAARQWSQATLAERLDVSVHYVGLLERGERTPSLGMLLRISKVFEISMEALVSEPTAADPWISEALQLLHAIPTGARGVVLAMLHGVARVPAESAEAPVEAPRARGRRRS